MKSIIIGIAIVVVAGLILYSVYPRPVTGDNLFKESKQQIQTTVETPSKPEIPAIEPNVEPTEEPIKETIYTDKYETEIRKLSTQAIMAIKNKDFTKLSDLTNDKYKLTLAPYYVHGNLDLQDSPEKKYPRQISKLQVKNFFEDTTNHFWGYADGSGFPLEYPNLKYYQNSIYPMDFSTVENVTYNKKYSRGNNTSLSQIVTVWGYKLENVRYIEYNYDGTAENYNMDWQSLALVFTQDSGKWYLVAILHNQWTI